MSIVQTNKQGAVRGPLAGREDLVWPADRIRYASAHRGGKPERG